VVVITVADAPVPLVNVTVESSTVVLTCSDVAVKTDVSGMLVVLIAATAVETEDFVGQSVSFHARELVV